MYAISWYEVLLISIPQTFLIIKIGFSLFNIEIKSKQTALLAIVIGVAVYFLRIVPLLPGTHILFLIFFSSVSIALISKIKMSYSLVSIIFGTMVLGGIESITIPLFLKLTSRSIVDLPANTWVNVQSFLPTLITAVLLYWVIKRYGLILYDIGYKGDVVSNRKQDVFVITTILIQTLLIITLIQVLQINETNRSWLIVWECLMLVLALFSITSIKSIQKSAAEKTKYYLAKAHLNQIEDLLNTLQTEKHEYSRHLQALQSMLYLDRNEEAKQYVNGIADNYIHTSDVVYIGHPAVTSLVNSKRRIAELQGIKFSISVTCDISHIKVEPWDLCSILGNVLDNAIEAAIMFEKGKPQVAVEFKSSNGQYLIYIHNTGAKIPTSAQEKVFQAGYTSKKSLGRGLGLFLTKSLVERYGGQIDITSHRRTTVRIILPSEGPANDIYSVSHYPNTLTQ